MNVPTLGIHPEDYEFAVYSADQGGVARIDDGIAYFVEEPGHSGFRKDDPVPLDWELSPLNNLAKRAALNGSAFCENY